VLFGRRVTFALFVLASQLLLIAVASAWFLQMLLIARDGEIRFVEANHAILYMEIALCALIIIFAVVIFILQFKRLSEKRRSDADRWS
jgi:hypothetical protein